MKTEDRGEKSMIDNLRNKYVEHLSQKGKGIFTQTTRHQLLGQKPKYENTFWWRIRDDVQLSLVDLALFVETANKNDVDKVITAKALEPFAISFFHIAFPDQASAERAKVAALFIKNGLDYLRRANSKHMTPPNKNAIDEIGGLIDYLVANIMRGENK
jgi:hypothetical protein